MGADMVVQNYQLSFNLGAMNKNEEQEIKKEFQLERVILFSDAVFAIIITIMVLDIRLPEGLRHADTNRISSALIELIPKIFAYGLSFFLVSMYWLSHLKMFSHLKDYDAKLLGYNLFYLFSVSLFPFGVTLISGNINPQSTAYGWGIYTYAAIIFLSTFSQTLLTRYLMVNRQKLCFDPDNLDPVLKYKVVRLNFIIIPVVLLLFAGLSFLKAPSYYAMLPIAIYGFTTAILSKKYYPEEHNRPVLFRLFETIKKRRINKRTSKQILAKKR